MGTFGVKSTNEGGLLNDGFTSALNFLGFGGDGTVPEGVYLNFMVFNSNFAFVNGGFSALGSSTSYVKRAIGNITFPEDGYLIAYVSFEKSNNHRAHFDDFLVTHKRSTVVQEEDYYPFGLTFNSYTSGTKNNYLYNQGTGDVTFHTERQDELQVDISKFRTYDYALGRWWQVDPLAGDEDALYSHTPYNYSFNNPIRYGDPEGDCPPWICGAIIGAGVEYVAQVRGNVVKTGKLDLDAFTNVDVADIGVAALAGAASGGITALQAAYTKTAIAGGVAFVQGLSEVPKAAVDVNVSVTSEGNVSVATQTVGGNKSAAEAGVELGIGVLSAPIGGSVTREAVGTAQKVVGEVAETGMTMMMEEAKESVKKAVVPVKTHIEHEIKYPKGNL